MTTKQEIDSLKALYELSTKHSGYQVMTEKVSQLLSLDSTKIKSRNENERLNFFKAHVSFANKKFADIGGNGGFFSLSALDLGAASVDYFEGNKNHCEFVKGLSSMMGLDSQLRVHNSYFDFQSIDSNLKFDTVLLLNVLHHVGDDFSGNAQNANQVLNYIQDSLHQMVNVTKELVFQMGFNWQGDRNKPIFKNGLKSEMIEFVTEATEKDWNLKAIGVASEVDDTIVYSLPNEQNLQRFDSLGEFLNRPIFILERK